MNELRFHQRPWVLFVIPPIFILALCFMIAPQGMDSPAKLEMAAEVLGTYFIILIIWLAFFSQFVLPIQGFKNRQKIFDRLIFYLIGTHGPAIFFRNGEPVQREGEERKKGPGVLWLDSASGVVTRTAVAFKNTFGPGVHFIDANEKIAGYVDLHNQSDRLGPSEQDDPFAKKIDQQTDAQYEAIQQRRIETTGLTRDGIEVVPNINITFKIDADPIPGSNLPGSRFGFNENAVFRAIKGQTINPNMPKDSYRYRVPWNQLPALLAADAWRDLLSKFTLHDLFDPKYILPPSFPNEIPEDDKNSPLYNPVVPQSTFADTITNLLKEANRLISNLSDGIEKQCNPESKLEPEAKTEEIKKESPKEKKVTGLQLINFLIRERLQSKQIAVLDRYGNYQSGQPASGSEYEILLQRGIRVLSVSISNLRFPPDVDTKLINQWTADWLTRARAEHERLDQEEGFSRIQNEENALREYIHELSKDLLRQVARNRAQDVREALRALMLESRVLLVNETQMRRQSSLERELLEEIIQWLEKRDP